MSGCWANNTECSNHIHEKTLLLKKKQVSAVFVPGVMREPYEHTSVSKLGIVVNSCLRKRITNKK